MTGLVVLLCMVVGAYIFLQQPVFGAYAKGSRLERMQRSPQFRDGVFHNEHPTPMMAEDASYPKVLWKFFFGKPPDSQPADTLPIVKADLKHLPASEPALIWFGHSSYLLRIDGKNILVDPVFSGNASPVTFFAKGFPGTSVFNADQFPTIDVLLITHDHYDHLDYKTILAFIPKTKHFLTSLGVGAHLERWGVPADRITELDWWEQAHLEGFQFTATPARHFSGRGLKRFNTLWSSFVLQASIRRFYLGGDSGYDDHFKKNR